MGDSKWLDAPVPAAIVDALAQRNGDPVPNVKQITPRVCERCLLTRLLCAATAAWSTKVIAPRVAAEREHRGGLVRPRLGSRLSSGLFSAFFPLRPLTSGLAAAQPEAGA